MPQTGRTIKIQPSRKHVGIGCGLLLMTILCAGSGARAQIPPCLRSEGPFAGIWSTSGDTPLAAALRQAEAAQRAPSSDAEKLYRVVLAEAERLPDTDACKAGAFFFASHFYLAKGQGDTALELQQRVVAIDETTLGADSPRFAVDLSELGAAYRFQQDMKEAEQSYRRALEVAERAPALTNFNRMLLFCQVAAFYQGVKKYDQAEPLLKRALDAASDLPPNLRSWNMNVRRQLAEVLHEEGRDAEADELLLEPAPAFAPPKVPGTSGQAPDLSRSTNEMDQAQQYHREGRLADAETYYTLAIRELESTDYPTAKASLSHALDSLGEVLEKEERDAEAEKLFLRALRLREELAEAGFGNMVNGLGFLGDLQALYFKQGRLTELDAILQRELDIQERSLGRNDLAVSQTVLMLAENYRTEKKYQEAIPLYQRALDTQQDKYGPDDARLLVVLRPYAEALDALNRSAEADSVRARVDQITKKGKSPSANRNP